MEHDDIVSVALDTFLELQEAVHAVVPKNCLLLAEKTLSPEMLNLPRQALKLGIIKGEDVCVFCRMDICKHYNPPNSILRFLKTWFCYIIFGSRLERLMNF